MEHNPFKWGRPDDAVYGAYNHQIAEAGVNSLFPKMNTQNPIITGTSVIGIKYKDGVILAADNMGSYGSLMRFSNVERLLTIGENTVVGVSGDISDAQQLARYLDSLELQENVYDNDGENQLKAVNVHEYLTKLLYHRRSQMNPLWNALIVGGFDEAGEPFMKSVDLLGVSFSSSTLATGFGAHLAVPLLRQVIPEDKKYVDVTEEQARKVIEDCMRVLFYRDARSMDKYSMVTIKKGQELKFEKDLVVKDQNWRFAQNIRGYGNAQQ
ncbi:Proteasome subunit beta type-7 [Scheffersomyces spartinae]|uniref:Proteasome subunit beta n=1 Tax=Scheffersomyces spartinae TaxID=45513 RepID=A0A9P7V8U8_9ASCO|nr:Proteasome subunit beta type-7 [Scheffersomyces spartinae]KAG7193344.1 Proteasome subunit beta type-7 [Scheffersomyces spartinae]